MRLALNQNPLLGQVFYNGFISKLEEIENSKTKIAPEVIDISISIYNQLEIADWHPFPQYQSLKKKLGLENLSLCLYGQLDEGNDTLISNTIILLRTRAHVLNFLDIISKSEVEKNSVEVFSLFGRLSWCSVKDCLEQTHILKNTPAYRRNVVLPIAYLTAIELINAFDMPTLELICYEFFKDMEKEILHTSSVGQHLTKLFSNNFFMLGKVESFINEANQYKNNFCKNLKKLNEKSTENAVSEEEMPSYLSFV